MIQGTIQRRKFELNDNIYRTQNKTFFFGLHKFKYDQKWTFLYF